MPETVTFEELKIQADKVIEAFGREFKPFERFVGERQDAAFLSRLVSQLQEENYSVKDAESESRALNDLRVRYTGKKSEWIAMKKTIGSITDNQERAGAGQYLFHRELSMNESLEYARLNLEKIIEALRLERDAIDVTIPGRRPRP